MTPQRNDLCAACLSRPAERLVLAGLRGWLAGYSTGDIACWEAVWNEHAKHLGPQRAKPVMTELSALVRVLCQESQQPVDFYPPCCRGMCRDECLALGMVTGCQMAAWGPARAAACALVGAAGEERVLECGRDYATALAGADLRLGAVGPRLLWQTGFLPPETGPN